MTIEQEVLKETEKMSKADMQKAMTNMAKNIIGLDRELAEREASGSSEYKATKIGFMLTT